MPTTKLKFKTKHLSQKPQKTNTFLINSNFSKLNLTIFALIFAGIGSYFLLFSHAAGITYYVSPFGSNSNNGTSSTACGTGCGPWQTIGKVSSTSFSAGQTVLFQGGQTFSGDYLAVNGSGSSGNPITFGSYGTGKATLQSTVAGNGNTWLVSQHDITFNNLIFDGNNLGSCVLDSGNANSSGVQNIIINNDEIENCGQTIGGYGIITNNLGDQNWTIENTYIHNVGNTCIYQSHNGNAGGYVVQNNTITACGMTPNVGYGVHGLYVDTPGIVIQNNDISNWSGGSGNGGQAVSLRYRNALVQGNTIHDGGLGDDAIDYFNYDATETAGQGTSTIRNNRIWNISNDAIYIDPGPQSDCDCVTGSPENWNIYNNTFNVPGFMMINFASTTDTALRIQNNVTIGGTANAIHISPTPATYIENHNDWYTSGTKPNGTGDITTNPNLTAAPAFVPNAGSPVINAGTTSIDSLSWTNSCNGALLDYCDSAPDMGATEYIPSSTYPIGDLNGDGHVNIFDLSIFLNHWQQSGSGLPEDFNNDTVVNIFDLSILLSHYGA